MFTENLKLWYPKNLVGLPNSSLSGNMIYYPVYLLLLWNRKIFYFFRMNCDYLTSWNFQYIKVNWFYFTNFTRLVFGSLEAAGILREIANYLDAHVASSELIASSIGVISAVIDNVPLVAATMGMYDVVSFPQDSEFWQLIAFCAGTGGSMLIIGSAAGVAFMGMEKVDFFWYLRKVFPSVHIRHHDNLTW